MSRTEGPSGGDPRRRPPQGRAGRRPQSGPAPRRRISPLRRWWIAGAALAALVLIGAGGAYFAAGQSTQPTATPAAAAVKPGGPIDGIRCGAMEGQAEHIHSHVALFWNGKPVTIPAYVGIPVNQQIPGTYCFYWLHTHATTDVVHIEAPASGTYTLGEFMDVWHYTALWDSQSTVPQRPHVDASFPDALRAAQPGDVHVYIGSKLVGTPYSAVAFADHRNITVELGTPLRPPVATFDWAHWAGL